MVNKQKKEINMENPFQSVILNLFILLHVPQNVEFWLMTRLTSLNSFLLVLWEWEPYLLRKNNWAYYGACRMFLLMPHKTLFLTKAQDSRELLRESRGRCCLQVQGDKKRLHLMVLWSCLWLTRSHLCHLPAFTTDSREDDRSSTPLMDIHSQRKEEGSKVTV